MTLPDTGSTLVIRPLSGRSALTLPPFSARGISQSLEPIPENEANIRRACDGSLIDMTHDQFRKYTTTVTCTGIRAPTLSKAWVGQVVEMDCAIEMSALTGDIPDRVVASQRVSGHFTFYKFTLIVMIRQIKHAFDEYPCNYNWQLVAEEAQGA